jgi:hypothetical protein
MENGGYDEPNYPAAIDLGGIDDALEFEHGYGSFEFAGTLLVLIGVLSFPEGAAAIKHSSSIVSPDHYIFGSLRSWGWAVACMSVGLLILGCGVYVRKQWARWAGLVALGLLGVAQLLMLPAYPFWSVPALAADVLAIFGLIACGHLVASASSREELPGEEPAPGAIRQVPGAGPQSVWGILDPNDAIAGGEDDQLSRSRRSWRGSAQKVTRTWNEWLAADSRATAGLYRRYVSALAEEEHAAAEVERAIKGHPTVSPADTSSASEPARFHSRGIRRV